MLNAESVWGTRALTVLGPQERVTAPLHFGPDIDLRIILLERWQNLLDELPAAHHQGHPGVFSRRCTSMFLVVQSRTERMQFAADHLPAQRCQ